jgi:protein-S-isoprenylcysteine O-methyltransferase Ste14
MLRQAGGLLFYLLIFAILLFAPARTLDWRDAWILLATLLVARGASMTLLWRTRRALMHARTFVPLPQAGQPLADRILLPAYMAAFAAQIAFTSFDVWRLHLLPPVPAWLRYPGLAVFAAGWWIIYLALRENAFALTVVRLQDDRSQDVVRTGPYAVVRHPMYSGVSLVMIGLAVWLGSWASVAAAAVPVGLLAARIVFEERLLRSRLAGYGEYAEQSRWRLAPGVW